MYRELALAVLMMAVAGLANSETLETTDCRAIDDALERLACYDAQHEPREVAVEKNESEGAAETAVPGTLEPGNTADPQLLTNVPAVTPEPEPQAEHEVPKARKRTLFGDEIIDLTTQISSVRKGDKQKMVFRLANGEIWMQTEPRLLPLYDGDVVTIGNATMGGYFLRTDKGVVTRVQRIAEAQP